MELTACRVYSEFLQVARGHWSEGILLSKLQQIQRKWSSSLDQDWASSLFTSSPEITALVRMWLIVPICSYSHPEKWRKWLEKRSHEFVSAQVLNWLRVTFIYQVSALCFCFSPHVCKVRDGRLSCILSLENKETGFIHEVLTLKFNC